MKLSNSDMCNDIGSCHEARIEIEPYHDTKTDTLKFGPTVNGFVHSRVCELPYHCI